MIEQLIQPKPCSAETGKHPRCRARGTRASGFADLRYRSCSPPALPACRDFAASRQVAVGAGDLGAPVHRKIMWRRLEGDCACFKMRRNIFLVVGRRFRRCRSIRRPAVVFGVPWMRSRRDAGFVADDGAALAGESVEQSGFPYVGPAHDDDRGNGIGHVLLHDSRWHTGSMIPTAGSGARTRACSVGTLADARLRARTQRREESRRGAHECVRHSCYRYSLLFWFLIIYPVAAQDDALTILRKTAATYHKTAQSYKFEGVDTLEQNVRGRVRTTKRTFRALRLQQARHARRVH